MFHLRVTDPSGCPGRVAQVRKCSTTGENAFCGEGCLEVTDENGYRLFNDHQCAFTQPLMWYCNINENVLDDSPGAAEYACAGERLVLAVPVVSQPNICPAGQKQQYPFFDEWPPRAARSSSFDNTDWAMMTPVSRDHGTFSTYMCANKSNCDQGAGRNFDLGWRMRGGFADSGTRQAGNSKSVLQYTFTAARPQADVLFNYISDGEEDYDFLEFEACTLTPAGTETCYETFKHDGSRVEGGHEWRTVSYKLPSSGQWVLKWSYSKDWTQSSGNDEARLLEIAITGFVDDAACTACPKDHCSIGRLDGCQLCPPMMFSQAGSATCTMCTQGKPDNSHFKMVAADHPDGQDCTWNCDPGYVTSSDRTSCDPHPFTCLLPQKSTYSGKFDPPSWAMLTQCLKYRHTNTGGTQSPPEQPYCNDAIQTLQSIKDAQQLDAQADSRKEFYAEIDKVLFSFERDKLYCHNWSTDYAFHQWLLSMLRGNAIVDRSSSGDQTSKIQPNAEFIYAPPVFYQQLYTYLPIRFNYTGDLKIYSDSVSELARLYGYRDSASLEKPIQDTFGWEVLEIDGRKAENAVKDFADSQVGFSPDEKTRIDLAVHGDYPTLWACSLAVRSLAMCEKPTSDTTTIKLRNPQDHSQETTIALKWTIMYFGSDCESTSQDSCTMHWAKNKDWLNCDIYQAARGSEKGHLSIDDMSDFDLAVELHHKWFDHKDLMISSTLSETSHTTHQAHGMTLTVLDSYEHVAAYAHLDQEGTKTGILRVASFHGEAAEFHAVMMEMAALNPSRLVIDLRTNGGGHVCHAMQLAYLVSNKFASRSDAQTFFDFRRTALMESYATNQSFYTSAHPEFSVAPPNFLGEDHTAFSDDSWYTASSDGDSDYTQTVSMNCERYSSLLEFYVNNEMKHTRKLFQNFGQDRIQVLVDSQCVGACALFARMAQQAEFGVVIGVGTETVGTAPAGISTDLDGLYCQWLGMKLQDGMISPMPNDGQNLVFPLTRLHKFKKLDDRRSNTMDSIMKPDRILSAGTYRPDFVEGKWYSGMELYCDAIATFNPSTSEFKAGCPHCTEECSGGMSAGWAFFWILFGIVLVPLCGGIIFYFSKHGCSADSVLGICSSCKEFCMNLCGSRWERSYGSLSGDPSEGMPSVGCCQGFDWRSYVPGMKGSALEDQYSGLQPEGEMTSSAAGHSEVVESNVNDYAASAFDPDPYKAAPAFVVDSSSRVEIGTADLEEKTANL